MYRFVLALALCVPALWGSGMDRALSQAAQMQLAQSRYWQLLLHMNDGVSEIDDSAFFLAENGNRNASAELNATIKAFYNEVRFDDNATGCLYPARRFWLKQTLHLEDLPVLDCREYDTLVAKMQPRSVTLVFSSAHINSPASMFGHTLLRLDTRYDSKMLSYAVNYAAAADQSKENGVVFALKGLFGGYPGRYSLLPYYDKLKEYRDTDQRDIWEYDLDLSREQVMMMVRHIWELKNGYNWYYFFDENCSYNMLWLIEVARPDVDLRRHFVYQVIPMETVHAANEEGLITQKHFRPSKRTVLHAYEDVLDAEGVDAALALSQGEFSAKAYATKAQPDIQMKRYVLEAASELAQYTFMKGRMDKATYTKRFHSILSERAKLGKGDTLPVQTPSNPINGHRAIRAEIGTGWRDGLPMQTVGIRPAYHDLGESDIGFLQGTQIEFLDLTLRKDAKGAAVEKATILSLASIAPATPFFSPFSWRMHTGWDQGYYRRELTFNLSVGVGYAMGGAWGFAYGMVDPELFYGTGPVTAVKPSLGFVIERFKFIQMNAEAGYRFYDNGVRQWIGTAGVSLRLSQNNMLKIAYDYTGKLDGVQRTAIIEFAHYF